MAELGGLEDAQLWALGGAVVARLMTAVGPLVGEGWEPGSSAVDAIWRQSAGTGDAPLAAVHDRFEELDVESMENSVGGLWLVQALKVAALNLLDPGALATRVSLASGSAIGAWEMFAEYEFQNDGRLEWADKYSSLPLLVELGAQRADLAMVRLDWDSALPTGVLRSRADAVGEWQAEWVAQLR